MTDLILLLMGTAGGGGWYVWTGHVHRRKPCRACGGFGYQPRRGLLSIGAVKTCPRCDGEGEVFRLAARHVQRRRAIRASRAGGSVRGGRKAVTWR